MAINLTRLTEKTPDNTILFKWETTNDVGVIRSTEQLASIWLDSLGISMSMALFLKDINMVTIHGFKQIKWP